MRRRAGEMWLTRDPNMYPVRESYMGYIDIWLESGQT